MQTEQLFSRKNIKTIAMFTLIFIAIGLILSLLQTPKYQSSVRMLVVFNQEGVDPYTATRTNDYITGVLGEVVYSDSFMEAVFKSGFALKDDLGTTQRLRTKNWRKMVKTTVQENKGIIAINVLHSDRNQADQFARAIATTLVNKHQMYHGLDDKITIRVIDNPVVPDRWAEPNILRNVLIGLFAGFIISLTIVVIFPQQRIFELSGKRWKKNKDTENINLTDIKIDMGQPSAPTNESTVESESSSNNNHPYQW